jgi:hypothetical protein
MRSGPSVTFVPSWLAHEPAIQAVVQKDWMAGSSPAMREG